MVLTQCYSANNPNLTLQPNGVFNGLSNVCCPAQACLRGFVELPQRLSEFSGLRQLVYCDQGPLYCSNPDCMKPFCNTNSLRDVVVERMAQVRNWMQRQTPQWHHVDLFLDYLGVTMIYYQVRHGMQQRLADGRPKRNVVNVIVFHPYHNAFRWHHFTYRYAPSAAAGMHALLNRILREAAMLCTNSVLGMPGFHCRCPPRSEVQGSSRGPPPPAVPGNYVPTTSTLRLTTIQQESSFQAASVSTSGNGCRGHCTMCGSACNGDGRSLPIAVENGSEASLRPSVPTDQAIPDALHGCASSDSSESLPRVLDESSAESETVDYVYYGPPSPSASPSKLFAYINTDSDSNCVSETNAIDSASVVSAVSSACSSVHTSAVPSVISAGSSEQTSVAPSDDGGELPSLVSSSESGYLSGPGSISSIAANWDDMSVGSDLESVADSVKSVDSIQSSQSSQSRRFTKLSLSQNRRNNAKTTVQVLPPLQEKSSECSSDDIVVKPSATDSRQCAGHGSKDTCNCFGDSAPEELDEATFDIDCSFSDEFDIVAYTSLANTIDWDAPFSQCETLDNANLSMDITSSQLEAALSMLSSSPMQEELLLTEVLDHMPIESDVPSSQLSPQISVSAKLRAALTQLAEEVVAEGNKSLDADNDAYSPSLSPSSSPISMSPCTTTGAHDMSSSSDDTEPSSPDVTFIDSPMPTPPHSGNEGGSSYAECAPNKAVKRCNSSASGSTPKKGKF